MPCKKRRPAQCHSSHPQRPLIPVSPISMLQEREGPKRPPARCNIEVGVARGARQSFTVGLRPSERAGSRTARIEHNNWGRLRAKLSIRSTHAPGGLVNHFLHLRLPSWGTVVDECVNAGLPYWSRRSLQTRTWWTRESFPPSTVTELGKRSRPMRQCWVP